MKKYWVLFVLIGILVVGFFIYQSRSTTLGDVLSENLSEGETVNQVYVRYYYPPEDKEMILKEGKEIVDKVSDMELKPTNEKASGGYYTLLETNKKTHMITFDDNGTLSIAGKSYQIEGENTLLEIIKSNDDKWAPRDS